jgi:hypothetical protein
MNYLILVKYAVLGHGFFGFYVFGGYGYKSPLGRIEAERVSL